MFVKNLRIILMINYLLFFHLVFGFNGISGWYLPSFLRFNDGIEDPPVVMDDDSLGNLSFLKFFEISNEERMIIEHGQAALTTLEKKQDCFKEATITLKNGCRNINLSNNDKMQYAIRLTKCELAIANLAFPMECDDFDQDIGKCIESISRIPQFWTTYSGYFREVSQMCFAMRYSLERDLLEEYNRNVTFKYHHILKHLHEIMMTLRKEEVNRLSQIKQFLINLAKDVNELEETTSFNIGSLKGILSDFQIITQSALSQIIHLNEELGKFVPNARIILDEINNANEQQLSTIKELTVTSKDIIQVNFEKLGQIYQHLQKIDAVARDILLSQEQVYDNMEDVKNKHGELLDQLQEAKNNLQNLLEISQNEIQELTKSLSDAKKIHQDFMKILKPLSILIDFINWIYDGKPFTNNVITNNVIYVIPLFAIIFWILFGKIVAISLTMQILYRYITQYETFDERFIQSFVLVVTGGILTRIFSNGFEDQVITKIFNIIRGFY
ncbi:nuclear fusion protein [Rhizophagus clarus]|uniref:Nuclear fusion protein n=2 Tax=Rhizophagus clarus TaxID=94130 RepID=A0A8H3QM99_9GLOM|nr:nuclear fusion protein [Rhizophagus clarus]